MHFFVKNCIIYSLILLQTYTNVHASLFSAEVDGDQEIANFKNSIIKNYISTLRANSNVHFYIILFLQ